MQRMKKRRRDGSWEEARREEEKKETLKESKILEALNHPNIVKFKEVYKTKKGRLCIVMEYADGIFNFKL